MKKVDIKGLKMGVVDISDYDMMLIDTLCLVGLDMDKITTLMKKHGFNRLSAKSTGISRQDLETFCDILGILIQMFCDSDTLYLK